jgi:hypothetical protein
MTTDWTPDAENASDFARYKKARETEKELKPRVRAAALDELRRGATPAQLSQLTGESAEVFRRIRDAHNIPVDPRYQSRAELARARKAALSGERPASSEEKTA